ncbi:ABC transporter permease subunit [Sinorhizobium meliloti]|uniref:ABC transporter permease subunit n=1 Tax=Sinorhizobium medicae TaxID=110321 RepID=UPI00035F0B49|nr:ABC transporter permease subunit [Sinorhizobium medicae]MDW9775132.1 ABC transporter permease subunit [Sinorhizobium meliloti]MDW9849611.1 ABC transporter permease subunit [Sinorhizobium meliloti]MDX0146458.1 ABC transporter permease subunit [Sinorhizobium meliloti]MDX0152638.1 ABC transporter permease subunit [Sinorhizobium meliloti]MDX0171537.1 ABC transporter permease subunit [Sinorhizobium meliloti]
MSDIVQATTVSSARERPEPKLVKMVSFGVGEKPTVAISATTGLAVAALWWLVAELDLVPHLFLPHPGEVLTQVGVLYYDGYAGASLSEHIFASLFRIVVAASIAIVAGIPFGLFMGLNRWAKGILDTPIEFYWPLPPLSYLPLMIIWLGIGETSKITLLVLAMFAPICLSAQAGVRSLPIERVNAARSLGAGRLQLFTDIVLPSALPEILTGVRIAVGIGWSTLVAAELIASTHGIGFMIMSAAQFLATDVVFVGIGIIAICAFAFSAAIRFSEAVFVPWKGKL